MRSICHRDNAARVGVRMLRAFGAGNARQGCGAGKVAVREQQGRRLKHENARGRDGETRNAQCNKPFHDTQSLKPCVCVISVRHEEKLCVRQQCVVHPPSHTCWLVLPGCVNPQKSSIQVHLDLPPRIIVPTRMYSTSD